jgi:1,4-alpha-glucan branching enzyme
MLPIWTICALFLVLVASLQAKEEEFRFEKPEAQTVDLMAQFNQWKGQPMTKQSNGTWTIKVSIPPGTYGYKFLVDEKEWVFDPKNSQRKTVDGVENSSIEIREEVIGALASLGMPARGGLMSPRKSRALESAR